MVILLLGLAWHKQRKKSIAENLALKEHLLNDIKKMTMALLSTLQEKSYFLTTLSNKMSMISTQLVARLLSK